MNSLRIKAPAKINLGLGVMAKRGDGFHEIDTLLVRLALHDVVNLKVIPKGINIACNDTRVPKGKDNLAAQAAQSYFDATGVKGGIAIEIDKNIPVAAGLGGGSSNAAAVLLGLLQLYPHQVDLLSLAQELGSDVPFFVLTLPAARARGRGERLQEIGITKREVVLINPGIEVRSKDAYRALNNFTPRLQIANILTALAGQGELRYFNGLQSGISRRHAGVRSALKALRGQKLEGVLMSGSGSTCFGLASGCESGLDIARKLRSDNPTWWVHTTTLG
ncbi:MAG: 4-(cytidine 5'-diphospho)-2-C-methyl-D-erythritol kinase [Deinococcales bacterium]|nr:4-(cytidine 5'-diphospho)-2-C-methyl-D-erythritol kinase [Deinococcales bacterium]